jgi:hypothetical protein
MFGIGHLNESDIGHSHGVTSLRFYAILFSKRISPPALHQSTYYGEYAARSPSAGNVQCSHMMLRRTILDPLQASAGRKGPRAQRRACGSLLAV